MHQPFYKNPFCERLDLPWVRLHALKDYYGMVNILKDFSEIKATYNLVPSLLVQLEGYINGERDVFQDIFIKNAENLKKDDIDFLVRHFFSANYNNLIKPFPRYNYLYTKKEEAISRGLSDWGNIFSVNELRDLQIWFQLCYFDKQYKEEDKIIKGLIEKGENFSEKDKQIIEKKEMELLKSIIPEYKRFYESGQIEISTSPFYHPILPLLIDPKEGKNSNPYLPEYDLNFNWKQDAISQVRLALDYMERMFGNRPNGMWPSEGSLSEEVVNILDGFGLKWTASDEINLSKSISVPINRDSNSIVQNPEVLYKPYLLKDKKIRIFFRDHCISDLIGFHYQSMSFDNAAKDLIEKIKAIRVSDNRDCVVPIILDGENPWEYYSNSGRDFLGEFFRLITEDENVETVTFSEVLDMECGVITHFSSGSWINGNFDIWIGDELDRKAWRLLKKTKDVIEENRANLSEDQIKEIDKHIYIAEGSDWFWWFGKENYTPDIDIFDNFFRINLQKVYTIIGIEVPDELLVPIVE